MNNIVTTQWLADHLGETAISIFDCSWHLPSANRNAQAEFVSAHIKGAQFFDIDATSDKATALPHMLPSPENFGRSVSALGATNDQQIVCYDSVGLFSTARVWWMFKVFGHRNVAVLDGGLRKWLAEGRETESGPAPSPQPGLFRATFNKAMVRSMSEVASASAQVADARSPARFRGEEPEPRPGVRPGHMLGAKNVHYAKLLNVDGTLLGAPELRAAFGQAGVALDQPIITSCGSGVTAAILTLGLTELGAKDHSLYDGSWAEWGASANKIVTG